jgi:hypothetical protein
VLLRAYRRQLLNGKYLMPLRAPKKDRRDIAIGRLVYGRSYLARADAVPIDPIELRLRGGTLPDIWPPGRARVLRGRLLPEPR